MPIAPPTLTKTQWTRYNGLIAVLRRRRPEAKVLADLVDEGFVYPTCEICLTQQGEYEVDRLATLAGIDIGQDRP